MTDIVLSTYPEKPNQSVAQLAAQLWLQSFDEGEKVMAWDKDAKASTKEVVATEIPADKVIVEYPVIFSEDNMTFTSTVILPQEDALFLVDQKLPTLDAFYYMANNGGKSVQRDDWHEITLSQVVELAYAVEEGTSTLDVEDYLFGKEDDSDNYLLLLFKDLSTYKIDTIVKDIFGDCLPYSVKANLKEKGTDDSLPSGEPEIMESAYVGTITLDDKVVPRLTVINIINIPLIGEAARPPE